KVSWLPFGGYVQMFGDMDPASAQHADEKQKPLAAEEKKVAFYAQSIAKRSAIVAAGPAVNFIFAIFILTGLYTFVGQPYTPPVVGKLEVGSPAEKAGIRPDDKILYLNDRKITRFQDMVQYVSVNLNKPIVVRLVHSTGKDTWSKDVVAIRVTPALIQETDRFGFKDERGRLGIYAPPKGSAMIKHTLGSAFVAANADVWGITADTLKALWQMIKGTRSANELGGILRIGAYAGDFAQQGIVSLISFAALLSVNLGLINFLPVPMLDGGHLAFYAMEKIRGKPPGERFQEYALRVGLTLILGIMLFSTWNDLIQLKIISYVKHHIF
ncbi:MAG: RIP metalloprotease, partial [Alphaproteobacteria bacterium]|nr:RIP metalloprotease [Alphaproteobacteria bacterium]